MEIDERGRSTSDQMLDTIEQLRVVETEKSALPPGSQRFQKLAREAERLANTVMAHAQEQAEMGAEASDRLAEVGDAVPPINETPRDVATILGEWRDAERRASGAERGSPEALTARRDVDRLREEYQRAHRAASRGPTKRA
jgi:hypothetical protein